MSRCQISASSGANGHKWVIHLEFACEQEGVGGEESGTRISERKESPESTDKVS